MCQTDWINNQTFVGERAAANAEKRHSQGKRRSELASSAKKNSRIADEGPDEAPDVEDQEGRGAGSE